MRSSLRITVLLILIFTTLPTTSHAFANYLLSNIGCMTDLSTDEVIMNSNVVAASDSDRPDVRLQLVSTDNARTEALGDGSTRVYLSKATASLPLQLVSEDPLNDVQFVVETTEGAQMENGQCDNAKRVVARGKDTVTLQLLELDKSSPIFVWAGWAMGHEAVRLTPALEFHYEADEPKKSSTSNADTNVASQDEKEQVKKKLEEQLNEYQEETDKIVKKKEKDKRHHPDEDHRREHDHHRHRLSTGSKSGGDKKGEVSSRLRKSETSRRARKSEDPNHHHNNHLHKSFTQKVKEHIAKHKKKKDSAKTEPGIKLDTTWFVLGLGILLVGNFIVVQCCTFAAGKAGDSTKGRPHTL